MVTALEKILIRVYRKGDEEEINRLFNVVFHGRRSLDEWRWKFQRDPIITVADVEGKIVGQYANIVILFTYRDNVVRAAQPVDNLVDPELRGGGKLQLKMFALQPSLAQEGEIAFGFGFPNEIAYSVGKRFLKYQDLCQLPILFRRLNWRNSVRRRIPRLPQWILDLVDRISASIYRVSFGRKGTQGVVVKEVPTFDGRIDALWEHAKGSYGVLAVRDSSYLRWRYLEKPYDRYTILVGERSGSPVGFVVLKVMQEGEVPVGLIIDFLSVEDAGVDDALVRGALRWFLAKRADYVLCWMLREDRVYRALTRCGFREHPDFPPLPVVYKVFSSEMDETYLKDPRHWHLTFGDTDGV